jgi:hypothetical protein
VTALAVAVQVPEHGLVPAVPLVVPKFDVDASIGVVGLTPL